MDEQFDECVNFCREHNVKGGAVITACKRQQHGPGPLPGVFGKWGLLYGSQKTMVVRHSPH